jgi:hypothetical protein
VIAAQLGLGKAGVQLDLVHRRDEAGLADDPVEVRGGEVGHADRPRPPVVEHPLEPAPGVDVPVPRGQRPVDQVEVDVVRAQPQQALLQRADGLVPAVPVVGQLGGQEHVLAGQAGLGERLPDALLVAVHLRGVDVPVARVERLAHRLRGVLRRDLEDAEADLGDLDAVVEPDARDRHAGGYPFGRAGARRSVRLR